MPIKTIKLSLVASLLTTINLYAKEDLGTITISSATKSEQSIKDITSSVEVITGEELEQKHVTTVAEALNLVSGISFTSNGGMGQSTSVKLRGFDSKRILVLIDGIRYNDLTGLSGAVFENLMVDNIQQIEIIKGAQSGIWGADASAGVINIITKTAKEGFQGTLNAEYGSFNTKKYGTSLSYKADNYYAKINAQRVTSDGFSAQAPRGIDLDSLEDDSYENTTLSLKTGVNIDDSNKIDFSHTVIDSEVEYDGYNSPNDSLSKSTSKTKISGFSFENKNSLATTNISLNRSDFFRDIKDSYPAKFDGKVDEASIKTNIPYLDDSSFVILGVDYKKFEETDDITNDYKNKAFFITNSNRFDKLILTQSLRVDSYDT
ncbi:MAG: TonB-dependent receptor plug domain-containing protein, partial [Arcobacteraceae bacterium]